MSTKTVQVALVDAFAADPFKGNPAAVCLLPEPQTTDWMQAIAVEFNQPATVFLRPRADEDGFDLQWFAVKRELELCGHGTLAATHFLKENGMLEPEGTARYYVRSGRLSAKHAGNWIELDFPAKQVVEVEAPMSLQVAIGENEMLYVGQNQLDLLVELESEEAVRELQPNLDRLASIDVRGLIVTAKGSGEYDFVSRFFAPRMGLPEDYVTGSAHCALAPHWAKKLGKNKLLAYQASSRGGVLRLEVEGERVRIGGQAVTISTGALSV